MKIISLFFFLLSVNSYADSYSMRRCMLLPITDTAGNSLGYSLFEKIEARLKEDGWCEYQSSSEVIGIFSKYRDRLPEYLQNENVLKTVAERMKVGTLIRVALKYEVDKLEIKLDIVGENGRDIYLGEKTVLTDANVDMAATTIFNWLELYEEFIPYEGKVLGVLGDQVTFSFPKSKTLKVGQPFKIKRLISKKPHPLLKKIVEWDSKVMAEGKIFSISRGQALGVIKTYNTEKKPRTGDWVKSGKYTRDSLPLERRYEKIEHSSFGRLGDFALSFSLASHTTSTNAATGTNKMGGYIYGIAAEFEAWVTRNYFVIGEFGKKIGNLTSSSGSPSSESSGQNTTTFKLAGGYKFLPMGFFYGPQINAYVGYANYSYQMDTSATDGFSTNNFSGVMLGVGGNIPLQRGLRLFGSGEIMPFASFADDENVFGSARTVTSMIFEIGAQYLWSQTMRLMGSFEVLNNKAKTRGTNTEVGYSDSHLKVGAVFTF